MLEQEHGNGILEWGNRMLNMLHVGSVKHSTSGGIGYGS